MVSRLNRLGHGHWLACCCDVASTTAGCLSPTWVDSFSTGSLNSTYNVAVGLASVTTDEQLWLRGDATMSRSACIPAVGEEWDLSINMKTWQTAPSATDPSGVPGPASYGVKLFTFAAFLSGKLATVDPSYKYEYPGGGSVSVSTTAVTPAEGDTVKMRLRRDASTTWSMKCLFGAYATSYTTGITFDPGLAVEGGYSVFETDNSTVSTTAALLSDDFVVSQYTT